MGNWPIRQRPLILLCFKNTYYRWYDVITKWGGVITAEFVKPKETRHTCSENQHQKK